MFNGTVKTKHKFLHINGDLEERFKKRAKRRKNEKLKERIHLFWLLDSIM